MARTFPKTLAAVERHDRSQWAIADALLAEIGPPAAHGKKDGTLRQFEICAAWLRNRGFHYRPDTLRRWRGIANRWPKKSRINGMSFTAHVAIKSPKLYADYIASEGVSAPKSEDSIREWLHKRDGLGNGHLTRPDKRPPERQFDDCIREGLDAAVRARALLDAHELDVELASRMAATVSARWNELRVEASKKFANQR